jgi:hypothetical protein
MRFKLATKLCFFAALIFITTFLSCGKNTTINEREQALLSKPHQSLVLPIDSLLTFDDLIVYLNTKYCEEQTQMWPIVYLDLKTQQLTTTANRNSIIVGVDPNPCIKGNYDDRMILEIIKDKKNLLIEQEYTEIDSIPSYIRKQILSRGEDPNYAIGAYGNGIWVCTKKADQLSSINPIIYQTVTGYIQAAREYTAAVYGKKIDELSDSEYQEIYQEFTFHLSFKYTDVDPVIEFGL